MSSQSPPVDVIPVEAVELMGRLLERSLGETQHITNQLMEAYREERDVALATVAAIRVLVTSMLDGPYQPSASALRRALWPSMEQVDYQRRELEL